MQKLRKLNTTSRSIFTSNEKRAYVTGSCGTSKKMTFSLEKQNGIKFWWIRKMFICGVKSVSFWFLFVPLLLTSTDFPHHWIPPTIWIPTSKPKHQQYILFWVHIMIWHRLCEFIMWIQIFQHLDMLLVFWFRTLPNKGRGCSGIRGKRNRPFDWRKSKKNI